MPFFVAGMEEGAAEMWFGFIVNGPWRFIIIAAIVALIARRGGDQLEKMRQMRWICQVHWCAVLPSVVSLVLFSEGDLEFPPGSLLLRAGSQAQMDARNASIASLGSFGAAAVTVASFLGFAFCVCSGVGPFLGTRTDGSISMLYSNLVVELPGTRGEHVLAPVLRRLGLPLPLMTDTVTVFGSSHPVIGAQVSCERIAPPDVFAGMVADEEWRRAGKITLSTGGFPSYAVSSPGFRNRPDPRKHTVPVLPYIVPYFELRCTICAIVARNPGQDLSVVRPIYHTANITRAWPAALHVSDNTRILFSVF